MLTFLDKCDIIFPRILSRKTKGAFIMKRSFNLLPAVLVVLVLTLALTSCDLFGGGEKECEHIFGDTYDITAEGHVYACENDCGETRTEPHHYGSAETVTPSTCTTPGVGEETCIICEHKKEVPLELAAHVYKETLDHDDTNHWRQCANCDNKSAVAEHKYTVHGHDSENHWFTCECGAKGSVTAHTWSDEIHDNGTMTRTCTDETCKFVLEDVDDPNHTHTWTDGEITKPATCTATGTQAQICACGAVGEKTLDMIHHSFTSGEFQKNDTHHWQNCVCGKAAADEDKIPHNFGTDYVTEGNFKVYTCECGQEKREPVSGYIDPEGWT